MKFEDGLQSLALKLGQKQETAKYVRTTTLTENIPELEALWVENWIAQKICIKRSQDMIRRWRNVYSNDLTADKLEVFEKLERQFKLRETFGKALAWASLYGSCVVFIKTNGSQLEMPLQPTEKLEKLVIIPKSKVAQSGELDNDLLSDNYGKYSYYSINSQMQIHHSRLIILNANQSPLSDEQVWGISDLEPIIHTLKRFDLASINIGDLITESKVDVFHIDGLADKISAGLEGEVAKTMGAVQAIKSATNSLLLDTNNEYEQKELSFAGLKDLLIEFRNAVAGAADMPVTILFGQSAAGFASGEEDIQNYHESVHRLQEERLRPALERLDVLLCQMAFGAMPEDWWFEFEPLKEMGLDQQINMLNTFASATNTLIQNGILSEEQVANELKETGLFANISAEDIEALKDNTDDYQPTPNAESATGNEAEAFDQEIQAA